jgi:hypothetical protein
MPVVSRHGMLQILGILSLWEKRGDKLSTFSSNCQLSPVRGLYDIRTAPLGTIYGELLQLSL